MGKETGLTITDCNGDTLYGYSFLFVDGTIITAYGHNEHEAAKFAREEYFAR